jgi:hypothetical protein
MLRCYGFAMRRCDVVVRFERLGSRNEGWLDNSGIEWKDEIPRESAELCLTIQELLKVGIIRDGGMVDERGRDGWEAQIVKGTVGTASAGMDRKGGSPGRRAKQASPSSHHIFIFSLSVNPGKEGLL